MSTSISVGKDHMKIGLIGGDKASNRLAKLKIISLILGSLALAFHVAVFGILTLKFATWWWAASSSSGGSGGAVSSPPPITWTVILHEMKEGITAGDSRTFLNLGAMAFGVSIDFVLFAWLFSVREVAVSLSTSLWSSSCGFLEKLSSRESCGPVGHARALTVATLIDVYFGAMIYGTFDCFLGSALVLLLAMATVFVLGQAIACYCIGSLEKKEQAIVKSEKQIQSAIP